jgi:hypothetical protein
MRKRHAGRNRRGAPVEQKGEQHNRDHGRGFKEDFCDSGDLEADLPELMVALGQAAASRQTAVALIFDEMQYLSKTELSALIMAMHKVSQKKPRFAHGRRLATVARTHGKFQIIRRVVV